MLLNTLLDYLINPETGEVSDKKFHIKNHPHYEDFNFPYYFNDETLLIDSKGELAFFTFDILDSLDWDFVNEENEPKPSILN